MLFASPIQLSDADKLDVLRRLDRFRRWHSLDEERICRRCQKHLTGRDIVVIGGSRGCGPLRIICPTTTCNSIPMDWQRLTTVEQPSLELALSGMDSGKVGA
jgi:hypothetical protein